MNDRPIDRPVPPPARVSARKRAARDDGTNDGKARQATRSGPHGEGVKLAENTKNIDKRIAAEVSWSLTANRSERTKPGRQAFLARFEREIDPEGVLPSEERRIRAQHAMRAHMLRLAKRSVAARSAKNRN